jgi:hypothetical protein
VFFRFIPALMSVFVFGDQRFWTQPTPSNTGAAPREKINGGNTRPKGAVINEAHSDKLQASRSRRVFQAKTLNQP